MKNEIVYRTMIDDVKPHTNADKLELAIVGGWQCIVGKGSVKKGDSVVYIPINSILPVAFSDHIGVTAYLSSGRVKAVKLRGEKSYGIMVSLDALRSYGVHPKCLDLDAALGITKYEIIPKGQSESIPKKMSLKEMYFYVMAKPGGRDIRFRRLMSKLFKKNKLFGWLFRDYTNNVNFPSYDMENYRKFPNIISKAENVWITEKIHGTNFRAGWVNNKWYVGSHNVVKPESEECAYWQYSKIWPLKEIVKNIRKEYFPNAKAVVIYGEVFGPKIQKLEYGVKKPSIAFFDLLVDGKWVNALEFQRILNSYGLPVVPTIYEGPWSSEMINFANGKNMIDRTHIREGIVIKSTEHDHDPRIGRVCLKYVSDAYLLGDYDGFNH